MLQTQHIRRAILRQDGTEHKADLERDLEGSVHRDVRHRTSSCTTSICSAAAMDS